MGNEWLVALWQGCLASSIAILLVLALRRPWTRLAGASTTPLLWLVVPLSMLAVWLPAPQLQVVGAWGLIAELPMITSPGLAAAENASAAALASGSGLAAALLALWAAGVLAMALWFVSLQWRFQRRLGALRPFSADVLVASRGDVGPAVLGLWRPRIVVPADFASRYSPEEQALILEHERSHQRRGDVLANAVATGLRCLYWFNPLIHVAANRLRHDHELASDADVLRRYPHARRRYAETLLNVQLAVPGLPVGCLWQSSHPLKERILMLSRNPATPRRHRLGTALALGLSLSVAAVAWAAQPPRPADAAPVQLALAETPVAASSEPTYRRLAPPRYPAEAIKAGQQGKVILKVRVDPEGHPATVEVAEASLPGVFDAAAIAAVEGWRFNPARREGKSVESWVQVPICFALEQQAVCEGPPDALDGIYLVPPRVEPQG